jgi:hypothetical protein
MNDAAARNAAMAAAARAPHATGLAVAMLCLVLTACSIITVGRLKLVYLTTGLHAPAALLSHLGVLDLALAGAAAACAGAVLSLEIWHRGLSRLIAGEAPGYLALTLFAAVLWFSHALLAPGLLVTGDAGAHVSRIAHLIADLRDGSSLVWDNGYFAGGPFLQFTGPVFHWVTAAIGLLLGDPTEAVKVSVTLTRVASAGLMYLYLRRLGLARPAAFLGAVFYGGAFVQTYLFSIRSTFPQAINLAALPALLLSVEMVLADPRLIGRGWFALCLTAVIMIGNHQPTAVLAALYAGVYVVLRLCALGWRVRPLTALGAGGAAIGVASVYFIVPFLAEKSWTADDFPAGVVGLHMPDFAHMLIWGGAGQGQDYAAYLGLSVVGCAVSGIAAIARGPVTAATRRFWAMFGVLALASLVLTGAYVRDGIFTVFFVSAAAAVAVQAWGEAAPARRRVPAFVFVVFLVDIGPTALQPWVRPDLAPLARAGAYLAQCAPAQRVLEVQFNKGHPQILVGPDASPLLYARVQMLYGPHKMDATRGHNAMVAVSKLAEADFARSGRLQPETSGLLSLYNVGWIVGLDGSRMGLPASWPDTVTDPVLGRVARIATATPFLVSGSTKRVPFPVAFGGPPLWNKHFLDGSAKAAETEAVAAWRHMGVDLASRQAAVFLLADGPAMPAWARRETGDAAPRTQLLDYRVAPGRVHLAVMASGRGDIRLAHPMFPTLNVTVDGQAVQAAADVFSMMVLPLHAGRNDIDVVAGVSPLRRLCFWVTAAASAMLTGALIVALVARRVSRSRAAC